MPTLLTNSRMDEHLQERIERSLSRPTRSFGARSAIAGRGLSGGRMVVMLLVGALAGLAWMTFVGDKEPPAAPVKTEIRER